MRDDFPAPPVPVIPRTGTFRPPVFFSEGVLDSIQSAVPAVLGRFHRSDCARYQLPVGGIEAGQISIQGGRVNGGKIAALE